MLREKLEQAEWTLLDMKTLTSTDAYQLMSSIMKVVDEYEEAQTEYAANRYDPIGQRGAERPTPHADAVLAGAGQRVTIGSRSRPITRPVPNAFCSWSCGSGSRAS